MTIGGDYLGTNWKRKGKGWQKPHVVVSIHNISFISLEITDEHGGAPFPVSVCSLTSPIVSGHSLQTRSMTQREYITNFL